jgi:hypothetical protein
MDIYSIYNKMDYRRKVRKEYLKTHLTFVLVLFWLVSCFESELLNLCDGSAVECGERGHNKQCAKCDRTSV